MSSINVSVSKSEAYHSEISRAASPAGEADPEPVAGSCSGQRAAGSAGQVVGFPNLSK